MDEHRLGRLLRRLVLLSAPLPLAALGAACGGSASDFSESAGAGGASAGATQVAGAGGSSAGAGSGAGAGGSSAGAGGSNAGAGGSVPVDCAGREVASCAPTNIVLPASCFGEIVMVGAQLPAEKCAQLCAPFVNLCRVTSVANTSVGLHCEPGCAIGRRPAGLGEPALCDPSAVGEYFAEVAHLEAASVTAFRILRDELRAQGAPKRLVRAAARAARDEIRHTRSTGALARRFGGRGRVPVVARGPHRSLEAMAIENAVEGCVRETYGALVATRQAQTARDPQVRAAMMRIARDETRHAALSWSVGRWLESRLDGAAKRQVARAKLDAVRELSASVAAEAEVGFAALAGLPTPVEASSLVAQLERTLWS